jgi:uncharacterized protein (TIGR02757 family)
MISTEAKNLRIFLNQLQKEFHQAHFLSSDPLEFAHQFRDPLDQEAVALLAAVLAYGNVKQIRRSLKDALNRIQNLSKSPRQFVEKIHQLRFRRQAIQEFDGFTHRFNVGTDIVILFQLLNLSWSRFGSLGGHFSTLLKPTDLNISEALSELMRQWRDWLRTENLVGDFTSLDTFSYLLTSPEDGSCCKRWCMFLRWMGRKDSVDLGLWSHFLSPHQLIMPLDTHTGRISQYLGLTTRKSLNWKAAIETTESLKRVDPKDPTRYDFALSRLGILDICQRSYREEICKKCQLLPACRFAQKFSNGPLPNTQS